MLPVDPVAPVEPPLEPLVLVVTVPVLPVVPVVPVDPAVPPLDFVVTGALLPPPPVEPEAPLVAVTIGAAVVAGPVAPVDPLALVATGAPDPPAPCGAAAGFFEPLDFVVTCLPGGVAASSVPGAECAPVLPERVPLECVLTAVEPAAVRDPAAREAAAVRCELVRVRDPAAADARRVPPARPDPPRGGAPAAGCPLRVGGLGFSCLTTQTLRRTVCVRTSAGGAGGSALAAGRRANIVIAPSATSVTAPAKVVTGVLRMPSPRSSHAGTNRLPIRERASGDARVRPRPPCRRHAAPSATAALIGAAAATSERGGRVSGRSRRHSTGRGGRSAA